LSNADEAPSSVPSIRACLITNPRSGRGGIDLSQVLPVLRDQGWDVTVRHKEHGGHATELAQEAARDGYDLVIAAGGDGTLSEVVDGLVGTNVAVGVLPGGTVNLWARELGLSMRLRRAALQLAGSERRRVDVGHLRINGRHGRHFFLMAGIGIDGSVMARVSKPLKNKIGKLAVGVAAVNALPSFRPVQISALIDGVHWEGRVTQIVVGNTRLYGGFTTITPRAFVDDALLDICLITADGPASGGLQLASLVLRRQPNEATAEAYRAASFVVHTPEPLPVQMDGGVVRIKKKDQTAEGTTYSFSVIARGITMLFPRTYDGTLFRQPIPPEPPLHAAFMPASHGEDEEGSAGDGKEKRLFAIQSVGMETFTATRLHNGKVVTIGLAPDAVFDDGVSGEQPLRDALATLEAGQVVRIKGKKDVERGLLLARQVERIESQRH
jgi:YegS/Rv2252/BmrU family lipid kinase